MISLTRFCAYRFPKERGVPEAARRVDYPLIELTREQIQHYIRDNARLQAAFLGFAERGANGWILADGARWVSYGWMTNCAVMMPSHLGRNIAAPMDWIFYCGTHPDYRGRGAFTELLRRMASARLKTERPLLLDTLVDNSPSRRAVQAAGFEPRGMMWSLRFKIPKLRPLIVSGWNQNKIHPLIS